MKPSTEELECAFRLVLWHHVPTIFDCDEGEVVTSCYAVSGHIPCRHLLRNPRPPMLHNRQLLLCGEHVHPRLVGVVWHTSVYVPVVNSHAEVLQNPWVQIKAGACVGRVAHARPCLGAPRSAIEGLGFHVQGGPHISTIRPCNCCLASAAHVGLATLVWLAECSSDWWCQRRVRQVPCSHVLLPREPRVACATVVVVVINVERASLLIHPRQGFMTAAVEGVAILTPGGCVAREATGTHHLVVQRL